MLIIYLLFNIYLDHYIFLIGAINNNKNNCNTLINSIFSERSGIDPFVSLFNIFTNFY